MSKQPDGGPFFPTQDDNRYWHGASLRDAFAMAALTGFLAESSHPQSIGSAGHEHEIARGAYAMADAMLAAREQEGT